VNKPLLNIHAIIPTRGDRKEFVEFAVRQMENQTLSPNKISVIDYPPTSTKVDLASRFKYGIIQALADGADIIFFIEDDDFYRQEYIETMTQMWLGAGQPSLFGLDTTIYYHLGLKMAGWVKHLGRASMYSTMISKDFDISVWPNDPERFVDLKIWKQTKDKKAAPPIDMICLGIKHGHGKCGGSMHDPDKFMRMFRQHNLPDYNLDYLKQMTGPGFWFYRAIMNGQDGRTSLCN